MDWLATAVLVACMDLLATAVLVACMDLLATAVLVACMDLLACMVPRQVAVLQAVKHLASARGWNRFDTAVWYRALKGLAAVGNISILMTLNLVGALTLAAAKSHAFARKPTRPDSGTWVVEHVCAAFLLVENEAMTGDSGTLGPLSCCLASHMAGTRSC